MIAAIFPVDHFLIMTLYALLVSAFFALLWREERAGALEAVRDPARLARPGRSRRGVADVSLSVVRIATEADLRSSGPR